jgi:hypothetical protein
MVIGNTAKLDCDGFESRYFRRVFKIKPDEIVRRLTTRQMIEDIWNNVNRKKPPRY